VNRHPGAELRRGLAQQLSESVAVVTAVREQADAGLRLTRDFGGERGRCAIRLRSARRDEEVELRTRERVILKKYYGMYLLLLLL
jgi:hypothetical protein